MATKTLNTRIVMRNDTTANWSSNNPVLLKGEIGVEFNPAATSAGRKILFKIGDGVTAWNNLPYYSDPQASNIVDFSSHSWGTISMGGDPAFGFAISAEEYQEALRSSGVIMPKWSSGDQTNQIAIASGEMSDAGARVFDYLEIEHTHSELPQGIRITLSRFLVIENPEDSSQHFYGLVAQEETDLNDVFAALNGFDATHTVASAINDVEDGLGTLSANLGSGFTSVNNVAAILNGYSASYPVASGVSDAISAAATHYAPASIVSHVTAAETAINLLNDSASVSGSVAHAVAEGVEVERLRAVGAENNITLTIGGGYSSTNSVASAINNITLTIGGGYSSSSTVASAISALDTRIDALEGNHFIIAPASSDPDRHPDVASPQSNVIYLVAKPSPSSGYVEWLYLKVSENPDVYAWEEIGDTDIDLSNYYNKTEIDAKTQTLASSIAVVSGQVSDISVALGSGFSSSNTVASAISAITADYLTAADLYILDCGNASTNISGS